MNMNELMVNTEDLTTKEKGERNSVVINTKKVEKTFLWLSLLTGIPQDKIENLIQTQQLTKTFDKIIETQIKVFQNKQTPKQK